jgi:glycosyltransferase involved in cell wall biosynthesis
MRLIPAAIPGWAKRTPGRRPVGVCFVIDRLGGAGTEGQLLALVRHLDRSKVRPSLCVLRGDDPDHWSPRPALCPVLDLGLEKLASLRVGPAAARLAAFWRRHGVDVVQTYFLDSTYFAVPLARLCGVRRVVRVRNNTGYWLTPGHRRLGRLVGRLCTATLTNSEDGRRALATAEGLPPNRVRVIENGVDLDRFPPGPPPDTGRAAVRVGAVANLRPVKNIDGLVRAAAAVCRADARVRFEVAGEGEHRPDLERLIRQARLGDRFRLVGAVGDIPGFLAGLDVTVLPSHSESMSNALLEYMAAGRAIVATDVGSNTRLARPGREGLIVPATDDAALEAAIQRFLQSPPLARALGAAARVRAHEFSREAMVRRFEDFFVSLVTR